MGRENEMAYNGQILENPISGERFVFHLTGDDTEGKVLAFDLEVHPGGHVPGAHVHPTQEERFEVVRGAMKFRKGFRTVVAGPGDTVVVPPGTSHRFSNAGSELAAVRVEVRPALNMEQLYETVVALAREGRTFRSGLPKPLDLALFMREFEKEVQAPFAPGLVRAATAPLAWLAARRGLEDLYPRLRAERAARAPVPTRPGEGRTRATRAPTGPARSRARGDARRTRP
jgi:mannose-6-phosphate isomerase-like protein (cupin superfamily)